MTLIVFFVSYEALSDGPFGEEAPSGNKFVLPKAMDKENFDIVHKKWNYIFEANPEMALGLKERIVMLLDEKIVERHPGNKIPAATNRYGWNKEGISKRVGHAVANYAE